MAADDELVEQIGDALVADEQYHEVVYDDDAERVALVRSAGRKAGRLRGVKVQTMALERDGYVMVWVMNVQPDDPGDELKRRKREQQMRRAVESVASDLDL